MKKIKTINVRERAGQLCVEYTTIDGKWMMFATDIPLDIELDEDLVKYLTKLAEKHCRAQRMKRPHFIRTGIQSPEVYLRSKVKIAHAYGNDGMLAIEYKTLDEECIRFSTKLTYPCNLGEDTEKQILEMARAHYVRLNIKKRYPYTFEEM